eukprot:scaffold478_cov409-Prasinococcus_capsulatus_cf.AAC.19
MQRYARYVERHSTVASDDTTGPPKRRTEVYACDVWPQETEKCGICGPPSAAPSSRILQERTDSVALTGRPCAVTCRQQTCASGALQGQNCSRRRS